MKRESYTIIHLLILLTFGWSHAQSMDKNSWEENYRYGLTLIESDKTSEAIPFLETSLNILKQNNGENQVYGEIAEKLGELYHEEKNYQKAIDYYSVSLNHAKHFLKESALSRRLLEIGKASFNKGYYELGIKILTERSTLIEQLEGLRSETYAGNLRFLADHYKRANQLDQALENSLEAVDIIENLYGSNSVKTSDYKSTLCQIYTDQGQYEKALKIQDNVISLFKNDEKNSVEFASALFTKARILEKTRDFQEAIDLYKEARSILQDNEHGAVTVTDNNIGLAYTNSGLYKEALSYQLRALENTKPGNPNYEQRIENLAFLYEKLGDFTNSKKYYELAKRIWIEKNNQDNLKYGKLLNNIGKMYRRMGDLTEAKILFKDALDIFLTKLTEDHIEYGYQLNDYANTLFELGDHEEALKLFERNLQLSTRNNRINKQEHFNWQFNLAVAYIRLGRYEEALPLVRSATESTKTKLGTDHPIYGNMLYGLGQCYIGLNSMEEAIPNIKTSNEIFINEIRKVFQFRSEKEKRDFLAVIRDQFDEMQSIPFVSGLNSPELNEINLNNQLLFKGLLLSNSRNVLSDLSSMSEPSINNSIQSYRSSKSLLEKTLGLPFDERLYDVDSLKDVINKSEVELVKIHTANFSNKLELNQDWKRSRNLLSPGEIVIDFSSFDLVRNGQSTDSTMYVTYIYKHNSSHPERIEIAVEDQLNRILANSESNTLSLDSYNDLYELIWEPLEEHLRDVETIYFSPAGKLNQLPLAALLKNGETMLNRFDLVQLSNPNILAHQLTEPSLSTALLIGGIKYDYEESPEDTASETDLAYLENAALKNSKATRSRGESWTFLPGSLVEIEGLSSIFEQNQITHNTWTGVKASEAAFKELSESSPNILHIATHGFFYENQNKKIRYGMRLNTEDRYRLAEDPLLRSGIILSGANYTWKNGSNPYEEEDGILTAMEISNLDLSKTELVVLSACETGLGDIDGSEGVYGLQRAFKMAGVDLIVMSLWQVPDAETAEFMNLLYANWIKNKDVRHAFNITQRRMQEKYKDEPEKWAAFVLFE